MKKHTFFGLAGMCITLLIPVVAYTQAPSIKSVEPADDEKPSPWQTKFWEGWLTPQQYSDQAGYVRDVMADDENLATVKHGIRTPSTVTKWEEIGPSRVNSGTSTNYFHGRVRSFKWSYNAWSSEWEAYLGASSGGLWYGKMTLTNREWTPLGDNLPNPSVGAFEINPIDRSVIFVGTGDWGRFTGAGLYKTTDRGDSWKKIPLMSPWGEEIPGAITSIRYTHDSVMWLSSDRGVYKSTNNGATWNLNPIKPGFSRSAVYNLVIDPTDTRKLYAALGYQGGIWRSTDDGTFWVPLTFGLPDNLLYGSTLAIDISASNPAILYASIPDTNNNTLGIWKTTDRGNAWNEVTSPNHIHGGQGFHTNVIRVDPNNPDIVYAGSVDFYRSTNGGSSWTGAHGGHADLQTIEFSPSRSTLVDVGSDGGIFPVDFLFWDDGLVDNSLDKFLQNSLIQSYALDYAWSESNVLLSGTQDNGTLLTQSPVTTDNVWDWISGCDGPNHISIDPTISSYFYFNSWCGSNNPRLRSLNKGGLIENIDRGYAQMYYTPISLNKGIRRVLYSIDTSKLIYSTDQGGSWHPATAAARDFAVGEHPKAMATNVASGLAPDIAYVWYWGTNDHGIHPESLKIIEGTPGSMTQRTANLPLQFSTGSGKVVTDRWSPNTVYAIQDAWPWKIFKSTDACATPFREITGTDIGGILPEARKYDIVSSPTDPNTMYVGTDFGVFKTTNDGATWKKYQWGLPVVPVTNIVYVPGLSGDPDTMRIGTFGKGFYQRVINGDDPPIVYYRFDSPIHGLDFLGEIGLAVGVDGRVAVSTDDGKTWAKPPPPTGAILESSRLIDSLTGLAAGLEGTIIRTTDRGSSWAVVPSPVLASFFDLRFTSPLDGFAVGNQGTIIRSIDGGQTWQTSMTGTDALFHSVFFTDPLNGWISGTDSSGQTPMVLLLHTTDGGTTWNPAQSVGPGGGCDITFPDPMNGYLTTEGGGIYRTADGGLSWNPQQSGTQQSLHSIFFTNPDVGWACGDGGVLLHTTNGGQQWTPEESGSDSSFFRMALSGGRLFTCGVEGIFSRSTALTSEVTRNILGGWNLVSVPLYPDSYLKADLFPGAASGAFAYQAGYAAKETLQVGAGYWVKYLYDQTLGNFGSLIPNLIVPVNKGWNIVGTLSAPIAVSGIGSIPGGIVTSNFYGYEGGYSTSLTLEPGRGYWVKVSDAGQLVMTGPGIVPVSTRIRIEDAGEMPPPPPDAVSAAIPDAFALEQNYPNPFNPTTSIRYAIPSAGHVTLAVFNMLGQEVAVLVNEVQDAGYKTVSFDASRFPSGVYTCRITAGEFVSAKKMLLVK